MHYSEKMRIGNYIGIGIACVIMVSAAFTNNLMLLYLAIIFALVPGIVYESSTNHFKKNIESFSDQMKYCYSCGHPLEESPRAVTCPKCNARLKMLDIIDV